MQIKLENIQIEYTMQVCDCLYRIVYGDDMDNIKKKKKKKKMPHFPKFHNSIE